MRILLIACLLFLLFGAATLPVAGAAHQVCLPQVPGQLVTAQAQTGALLINEVVLASSTTWLCPGATSPQSVSDTAWVEIYNPQNQPIDLYASRAAIDGSGSPGTTPMSLPFGAAIAPQGFFTFFINKNTLFANNPGPFPLHLLISGIIVDQVTVPTTLGNNQSYARMPDGASTWQISDTPTIGISNVLPTPTPLPVPTLKPTRTPTVRHTITAKTPTPNSRVPASKSQPGTTAISGGGSAATVSSGVQPVWSRLQLPGTVSSPSVPSATTATPAVMGPPVAGSNDTLGMLRNVLFILLAVVFMGGLYWVGRRLKRLRSRS